MTTRAVVIGGGLTGLATAWHLRHDHEVVLLEASRRPGGEIRTVEFAGAPLDVGADAFLARRPEGLTLLRAAGFTGAEIVAPAARHVRLWIGGRLRPLPAGTVLGVPTDVWALARSRVLSPSGVVRAALEPVLPRRTAPGDRSVADLVGERYGHEVVERLVEPLLGGVYAGRADRLSAEATMAPIWSAAQGHRRLTPVLSRRRRRGAAATGPVFVTLAGGLSRLVDRLVDDLGPRVRTGSAARTITRRGAHWEVTTADGMVHADAVVLAVPPGAAASLLTRVAPGAARELADIRTASVAVIALAYDRRAVDLHGVSGFLVPRGEGRLVKAVTFSSLKWAHHAARDRFVLRASVGRGDGPALALADDLLADRVDGEVRLATGIRVPADQRLVVRWPDALPQYDVGHLARVARIRAAVASAGDGLHLGGAAFDGIGLAARAADALQLARSVRQGTTPRR